MTGIQVPVDKGWYRVWNAEIDKKPDWHFKILVSVNKNRNGDLENPVPVNNNRILEFIPEIIRIWSTDHLKINSKLYCIIEGLKNG